MGSCGANGSNLSTQLDDANRKIAIYEYALNCLRLSAGPRLVDESLTLASYAKGHDWGKL